MALSQNDPALNYDGSWGDASKDWPSITFPTEEEARAAYVKAWQDVKIPYGCYVLVDKELRLETPLMKKAMQIYLEIFPTAPPTKLGPSFTDL